MGKNSKRRKSYYVTFAKRQRFMRNALAPNMVGFLCTCNDREKECVKEAYHILNRFADELYGKEGDAPAVKSEQNMAVAKGNGATAAKREQEMAVPAGDVVTSDGGQEVAAPKEDADAENETLEDGSESRLLGNRGENDKKESSDEEEDIEAALKAEVTNLKKDKTEWRFQQVRCSAINCVFISTKLQDPVALSLAIMNSIIETQKQVTRRLLRLIPIQSTCKAHTEDIIKCGKALCKMHFTDKELSHYILFKARNNSSIKRDTIVQGLSQAILEASPNSKADRRTPEMVLCVEVIKDVCCFAFLPNYFNKYCKYNLVELALRQSKGKTEEALDQGGDGCNEAISEGKGKTEEAPNRGGNGCNEASSGGKGNTEDTSDQGGGDCNETNSDSAQHIPAEVVSESLDLQEKASEGTQAMEDDSLEMP